jgi:anti-sigma factor RsiW
MTLNEDRLRAYVDGELDAAQAAELEARLAEDADAAAFVAREQALRRRLQAAFAPVLDEPVPARLQQALDLALPLPVNAAEPITVPAQRRIAANAPWWAGIAAALVLGIGIGRGLLAPAPQPSMLASAPDGTLVAAAPLAQALSTQPGGVAVAGAPVQVAWTFRDRDGRFCRTFLLDAPAAAGLACREAEAWRVQVIARQEPPGAGGAYRQAASALPPAVLQAVDARIDGSALDAAAEAEALRRGFTR